MSNLPNYEEKKDVFIKDSSTFDLLRRKKEKGPLKNGNTNVETSKDIAIKKTEEKE